MAIDRSKGRKGIASEARIEAFKLYKSGLSYRQIAARLNLSSTTVFEYVKEELDLLAEERRALGMQILELEIKRLDGMVAVLEPMVEEGDLNAMDRYLKVMERRAKYCALDSAQKIKHEGTVTLEQLVAGGGEESN